MVEEPSEESLGDETQRTASTSSAFVRKQFNMIKKVLINIYF